MYRNRAWRRAQRERFIARGREYYKNMYSVDGTRGEDFDEHLTRWVQGYLATRQPCSRHCCGNPRRHFDGTERITMQERRQNERDRLD